MNARERIRAGEDVAVDLAMIEQSLSELWRTQGEQSESAVTKAALWNVLAHTATDEDRALATQALSIASASVPQRSIVIRAQPDGPSELASWISANCYLTGDDRQVCSEEIAIVAGGERVRHVPSLVNALLVPDMPVAAWWLGDLPDSDQSYAAVLLEPAERFIVDSRAFDSAADMELLSMIGSATATLPADLNWVEMEPWRIATASMFDARGMRGRVREITSARIYSGITEADLGQRIGAVLFAAWISRVVGREVPVSFEFSGGSGHPGLAAARIEFAGEKSVIIERSNSTGALVGRAEGIPEAAATVTQCSTADTAALIVRLLSQADDDVWYPLLLPAAARLARGL